MELLRKPVQDSKGNFIEGALVYVYETGTNTLAYLFEEDEVTAKNNPLTSGDGGDYGHISCHVENGTYDIRVVYGSTDERLNGFSFFDPDDYSGFSAPFATESEAQAGTVTDKYTNPFLVKAHVDARLASQAEAEGGEDENALMTPKTTADAISANAGGMKFLGTYTMSASAAEFDVTGFVDHTKYRGYILKGGGFVTSDTNRSVELQLLRADNGNTLGTRGGLFGRYAYNGSVNGSTDSGYWVTDCPLSDQNANDALDFSVEINNLEAGALTTLRGESVFRNTSNTGYVDFGGATSGTNEVNGVRFRPSSGSGTLNSGNVSVYGVLK